MTLLHAIARADMLRPNALDNSIKADWVWELEAEIAELMDVELPENPYPDDGQLLMPSPKDNIYALYVCAMIDLTVEDTALYANDYVVANSAIVDAKKWWRRHHFKKSGQYIRAFSWQPRVESDETFTIVNQELEFKDLVAEVLNPKITPETQIFISYTDDTAEEAITAGVIATADIGKIIFTAQTEPTKNLKCDIICGEKR